MDRGAKCISGGSVDGCFVTPTVLADVPADAEISGPVFSLFSFDNWETLASQLNGEKAGPVCRIYAKDIGKAMRLSSMLRTENCVINGTSSFASVQMLGDDDKYLEIGSKKYKFPFVEFTKEKIIYINPEIPLI